MTVNLHFVYSYFTTVSFTVVLQSSCIILQLFQSYFTVILQLFQSYFTVNLKLLFEQSAVKTPQNRPLNKCSKGSVLATPKLLGHLASRD